MVTDSFLFDTIAGHTYCCIGALTFLGRLSDKYKSVALLTPGAEPFESLVRWLVARQTVELGENEEDEESGSESGEVPTLSQKVATLNLQESVQDLPALPVPTEESLQCAGFNGRTNKYADTCYSFWNTATLAVRLLLCFGTLHGRLC